jgi:hypothetical protein
MQDGRVEPQGKPVFNNFPPSPTLRLHSKPLPKGNPMIVVAISLAILALVAVTFISGIGSTLGRRA